MNGQSLNSTPMAVSLPGVNIDSIPVLSDRQVITDYSDAARAVDYADWIDNFDALGGTKTDLGTAQNSTRHVYKYEFGRPEGIPVLFTGLTHGSEFMGMAAIYEFCRMFQQGSGSFFKWAKVNIRLVVVPFVNPEGFVLGTRANCNAVSPVNLNRNFNWRWGYSQASGTDYAGTSASSEAETQIISALLATDMPVLVIDCHNTGGTTSKDVYLNGPNYQLPQNRTRDHYMRRMASRLVGQICNGSECSYFSTDQAGLRYSAAYGSIHNYAASLGITAYTGEVYDAAWTSDSKVAKGDMLRAYVAMMVAAVYYNCNGNADQGANDYIPLCNHWSKGSHTVSSGTAVSPHVYDVAGNENTKLANEAVNAVGSNESIVLQGRGLIRVTASINLRSVDTTPRIKLAMYLVDSAGTEVGSFSSGPVILDLNSAAKYGQITISHTWAELEAGTYQPKLALWSDDSLGSGVSVYRVELQSVALPVGKLMPYYDLLIG